jgi:hypothetical protein
MTDKLFSDIVVIRHHETLFMLKFITEAIYFIIISIQKSTNIGCVKMKLILRGKNEKNI